MENQDKNKVDIINIMSTNGMPHISFCDFAVLKDKLIPCRAMSRIPKEAKTVIMALFPYKVREERPINISRYAAVPDYHIVCKAKLETASAELANRFPDNQFEVFIDNSPIHEVFAAAYSGLGVMGKNGLLIHEKYGSFVFLGEIVTDLCLDTTKSDKKCLDCGQCKRVCPTKLSKENCLSAVNQQKKPLTDPQIKLIKENGYIWGCDICAEVCPMNNNAAPTYIKEFIDGYRHSYQENEDSTGRAYTWRGEDVIKRNAKL